MTTAVRALLRGISQIFFLRSSLTGLLLLLAMALASPRTAALVLIGCGVQTLAAWVAGPRDLVPDGLMGYNGALVGAAASLSMIRVDDTALSISLTVAGALACVPTHLMIRRFFETGAVRRFRLPVATAPFCTVAGLLFGVLQPLIRPAEFTTSPEPLQGALLSVFNAFAEVLLSDGLLTGLVILVALLAGSWSVGLWGLLGAALALPLGLVSAGELEAVSTGLFGYSAVLTTIALGTVFATGRGFGQRLVCAGLGAALAVGLGWLLDPAPMPTYTWPFLISLWVVLIGRGLLTRDPEGAEIAGEAGDGRTD